MTKTERRAEFVLRVARLIFEASERGIRVAPFAYYRTAQEQLCLYNLGKSRCDGTTTRSKHQDWLAMDFAILNAAGTDFVWDAAAYAVFGELAEVCGLVWGGRWASLGDVYHVELPEGD